MKIRRGVCGVIVSIVSNGHDYLSSNPGGCLHFTLC